MAGQHGGQHATAQAGGHGDVAHGDHTHGTMDIAVQEKTFDGFVRMVSRAVILIIVLLIFAALVNA